MARKVTDEDIVKMNELYYKYHTYAAVAREVGFSASTVSKYVDKNYVPVQPENIKRFEGDLPEFSLEIFQKANQIGDLCELSEQELKDIEELWKELAI